MKSRFLLSSLCALTLTTALTFPAHAQGTSSGTTNTNITGFGDSPLPGSTDGSSFLPDGGSEKKSSDGSPNEGIKGIPRFAPISSAVGPEPASCALLGFGLVGGILVRRRRKSA